MKLAEYTAGESHGRLHLNGDEIDARLELSAAACRDLFVSIHDGRVIICLTWTGLAEVDRITDELMSSAQSIEAEEIIGRGEPDD